MQVIIPVAGKGSRLRPHTHTTAKPLLHVAGKPVLQHILDRLEGLPVSEIIFVTGHLGEQFKNLNTKYRSIAVEQKEQLGTAHAINMAKPFVKEPVLIIFADTIFDADLSVINKTSADGLIWAKEVEDYQRFGVIIHKNNVMQKIVEKPSEPVSKLANIGLYYFKDYKALFEAIDHVVTHTKPVKGEFFLTDAMQYMIDQGKKILVEPVQGWYDCGTWEILIATNRELLQKQSKFKAFEGSVIVPPVWIEDNVIIRSSVIGPNVSVAHGVTINNSVISESIINVHAKIDSSILTNSIVGSDAEVKGEAKKLSIGSHSVVNV